MLSAGEVPDRHHRGPAGRRGGSDTGFSLLEVMVAMAIISVVMAAGTVFFLAGVVSTDRQRNMQAAVRVASDAIEMVFAVAAPTLKSGRDQARTAAQWAFPVNGIATYLAGTTPAVDPAATSTSTPKLPFTEQVTVNGVRYVRSVYLGECWRSRADPSASCLDSPQPDVVPFSRVVIAVVWPDRGCQAPGCLYVTTTLVSSNVDDPVFREGDSNSDLAVSSPGTQSNGQNQRVVLRLRAVGGVPPLRWLYSGLPAGIAGSTGGAVTGTPTTVGTSHAIVTVTDAKNRSASVNFDWTVTPS